MSLRVTIDTDNAAFADGNQVAECARILKVAAWKLEQETPDCGLHKRLFDVNGNSIGEMDYSPSFHAGEHNGPAPRPEGISEEAWR